MALCGTRDLVFALPIACIDLLKKSPKPMQSQGFPNLSNLVFKVVRETGVEQAAECTISVVLDLVKSGSTLIRGLVKSR